MTPKPIVALVGRPNVGKSTLFNKIIGERLAIIEDMPGTTRDRLYGDGEWNGQHFTVVDTGGILLDDDDNFARSIRNQVLVAMREADVIVFVVDAINGLVGADEDVGEMLRRTKKPVILAANKAETQARRLDATEFYSLGLGEPIPITALHGTGVGDLLDAVVAHLPEAEEGPEDDRVKIALVGRPNVGKSSLLNRFVGEERVIVSDIPGTTRDSIDSLIDWEGREITLIDTAGIRRRGKIEAGVEHYSVLRAMKAIGRADVTLLLLDAVQGVTAQDMHVAGYVLEEMKSLVVVVNKWDLIEKETNTMQIYEQQVRAALDFIPWAPIVFLSALTGQRVSKALDVALQVYEERFKRIPTGELNRLLADLIARHPPPSEGTARVHFRYATQPVVDPPTFVFFVSHPDNIHFTYQRYLENGIRQAYGFAGTPIRMRFRGGDPNEVVEHDGRRSSKSPKGQRRQKQSNNK